MNRREPVDMGELYEQLLTSLYERRNVRRAQLVADRLAKLLTRFSQAPESIFIEECRSLVCEAKGDLPCAIKHRENEIQLIRRLHEGMKGTDHEDYILDHYDYEDLSLALSLLAILYHDIGQLDKAIRTLEETKQVCADSGIDFDKEDLLQEYMGQRPNATFYLRVSENGNFSVKQASNDLRETTPTSTKTTIQGPSVELPPSITRVEREQLFPPPAEVPGPTVEA